MADQIRRLDDLKISSGLIGPDTTQEERKGRYTNYFLFIIKVSCCVLLVSWTGNSSQLESIVLLSNPFELTTTPELVKFQALQVHDFMNSLLVHETGRT